MSRKSVIELLHSDLKKTIRKYGYHTLTLVQERAIPLVLNGSHVLISAPTGTGKTEAALFPIYSKLLSEHNKRGIKVLYITPLRALNRDIYRRMAAIAAELGISVAIRHGDTPKRQRYLISLQPPLMLITTPETLQFLLVGKRIRNALKNVKWVIIDEVHELIDSKRGVQLFTALERLHEISKYDIQRIALSATVGDLSYTARIVSGGRRVEIVEVYPERRIQIDIKYIGLHREKAFKKCAEAIFRIIDNFQSILVFANTRDIAEALAAELVNLGRNDIAVHHGSLSREERLKTENEFKNGRIKTVICTSSLELGIDIGTVDLVVQHGSPKQAIRLAQRVGRSGHREGAPSKGLILVNNEDDLIESVVLVRRVLNRNYEKPRIHLHALDVLAHQIVGMALEKYSSIGEIYRVITRSIYYKKLPYRKFIEVIDFLKKIALIKIKNSTIIPRRRAYSYYFEAASTIPDVEKLEVIDIASNKSIGVLDGDFVAANCEVGMTFVLAGRAWAIDRIDYELGKVYVHPSPNIIGAIPAWAGEEIPVEYKVAREVGSLRRRLAKNIPLRDYKLNEENYLKIKEYINKQLKSVGVVPDDRTIYVEKGEKIAVINACLGTRVNYTLGLLMAYYLSKNTGKSVIYRVDPYRVILTFPSNIRGIDILNVFFKDSDEIREDLINSVKKTELYRWRLMHVLKRIGVIEKSAKVKLTRNIQKVFEGTIVEEETLREIFTDKLDVETLIKVLEMIKKGYLRIEYRDIGMEEFSPISLPIIERFYFKGATLPIPPTRVILETVKNRILNTRVELTCLHCKDWNAVLKVKDIDEGFKCPRCHARMIAVTRPLDSVNKLKIFRKWIHRLPLSEEERKIAKEMAKSARLFLTYGRKAALALAGRGVGPTTAIKILSRANTIDEIIELILEAEKTYIRTRIFWD